MLCQFLVQSGADPAGGIPFVLIGNKSDLESKVPKSLKVVAISDDILPSATHQFRFSVPRTGKAFTLALILPLNISKSAL